MNSHNFENIYKDLGIDLNELGCIMLDVDGAPLQKIAVNPELLYTSPDPKKFWIKGQVAQKTPHITLLYGLLEPGLKWKAYVDQVLEGWKLDTVKIKDIGYFESPYGEEEPYYCIVAHIDITPELQEGHERLSFLPHVNTFPGYKAHLTLAYIKKDEGFRDHFIEFLKREFVGQELEVTGINYGGKE